MTICPSDHLVRDVLLHEEIARPYRHQGISGHPSHILKAFGRQEVPLEPHGKQGDEKQQTEDASPNFTTFPLLKTIPPKDISLKRNGSDVCAVFEGFMDYLSAMQLGIIASDWLILNSVSNVEKAVKVLQGYERIECYLDNDEAGQRAFQKLRDSFGDKVIDRSSLYADHKDLNDYLLSQRQV